LTGNGLVLGDFSDTYRILVLFLRHTVLRDLGLRQPPAPVHETLKSISFTPLAPRVRPLTRERMASWRRSRNRTGKWVTLESRIL
jgi:hypothetical protein